jgi:hypothetical protein
MALCCIGKTILDNIRFEIISMILYLKIPEEAFFWGTEALLLMKSLEFIFIWSNKTSKKY